MTLIDCDMHTVIASPETLFPYLDPHWHPYLGTWELRGVFDSAYPPGAPTSVRPELRDDRRGPAGSTLDIVRAQTLDVGSVEIAVLTPTCAIEGVRNPDLAAAVASAVNDWHIADWLEREPRLRAGITVPIQFPELAAREIDRVGDHPGFIQIHLPVRATAPYGSRTFYPILEAATRQGLGLGLHFGGIPGNPPTASGWPSWYFEEYAGMANVFQTQLLSLIAEGAFQRHPDLRVAVVEGGFSWLPAFLWRLDKEWRGLRREVPWVSQRPSAYVRDHVRFTVQPNDLPFDLAEWSQLFDGLDPFDLLMFATDYPHWHYDRPEDALPTGAPEDVLPKILSENARAFYRFGGGDHDG